MSELTLTGAEVDTLVALIECGPLSHGYEPSKSARDSLIERGLAVSIINKFEAGWTAATLTGCDAYKARFRAALGGKADTMLEAYAARVARQVINSAGSQP
ncbi:hypothetical protein [Janthinobacterium violaceinigrum]|uniref:Uncharacterized protein n=1 Tax=Janthinobacterium violaceinigrum TaxID=2654252 RepID=A0A6I1I5J6_9BURK|nr:hypothetical protein [Janthinobacterium violaceinigrum]KAB8066244.1 hypothetical protein GCN75_03345 [Janthinobacterium violaceinigrum]